SPVHSCVRGRTDCCTYRRWTGSPLLTSSRCGDDATPKTCNAGSSAPSCFTVKIYKQIGGFIDSHAMQLCGFQLGGEPLPDGNCQILGGRDTREKIRHFLVKKMVIKSVEHFAIQNLFQLLAVKDKRRAQIHFALHRYFQRVIISMAIRIVALAKNPAIFLRRKIRVVIVMRS